MYVTNMPFRTLYFTFLCVRERSTLPFYFCSNSLHYIPCCISAKTMVFLKILKNSKVFMCFLCVSNVKFTSKCREDYKRFDKVSFSRYQLFTYSVISDVQTFIFLYFNNIKNGKGYKYSFKFTNINGPKHIALQNINVTSFIK